MAVKIKKLDEDQMAELLKLEGDTVPLYLLAALHFKPPLPLTPAEIEKRANSDVDDDLQIPYGMQMEHIYAHVLLLKVDEPMAHEEVDGTLVFILPSDTSKISYEMCNAIHIEHNAWAYRLEPRFWSPWNIDGESPMSDAYWFFKPPAEGIDLGN